jgi:hypothetical protein
MIIIQKTTNQIDNQGHYFDYKIDHFISKKLNINNLCEPKSYYKKPTSWLLKKRNNQPTLVTTL